MQLHFLQRTLAIAIVLFFISNIAWGQYPRIQWNKVSGGSSLDECNAIQATPDGGYILVGTSNSVDGEVYSAYGGSECWITKLNANGTRVWRRTLGGTSQDKGASICPTNDGNYMIIGATSSINGDVVGGTHGGSVDCWLIKINPQGQIIWQKTLGGTFTDEGTCIKQTTDGGYIMSGLSYSNDGDITNNHGNSDYWVAKLDSLGNIQWQKSMGGSSYDEAYSICQTLDGGYATIGRTRSSDYDVTGFHGPLGYDIWVVKLDSIGNLLWQKALGGYETEADDNRAEIAATSDGGCIIATNTYSDSNSGDVASNYGTTTSDCWVVKLSDIGSIQWQRSYGGSSNEQGGNIIQTKDGGYIVAARTQSGNHDLLSVTTIGGYWIFKINTLGNIEWQRRCGAIYDNQTPHDIIQANDGSYVIAGTTNGGGGDVNPTFGDLDYWTVKLYPFIIDTSITMVSCIGSTDGTATITPSLGYPPYTYLWSNGSTSSSITGVAAGIYTLTITDIYATSMSISVTIPQSTLGLALSTSSLPSNGTNNGSATAVSQGGTAPYTYTWSNSTATGSTINNLAAGTYNVTVHDANGCSATAQVTVGLNVGTSTINGNIAGMQVLPNPTQDLFTVSFNALNLVQDAQVIIYNSLGQVLFSQAVTSDKLTIDLSIQASGLYWVQLKTTEGLSITQEVLKL